MKKTKRILIITTLLIIILNIKPNYTYSLTKEENNNLTQETEIIEEQKENFGISSFIENAEKYTGEFFEGINIEEMLNSAIKGEVDNSPIYKRIFNILGDEVKTGVKSIISILVIIIIRQNGVVCQEVWTIKNYSKSLTGH